jgi:hypothetical protein
MVMSFLNLATKKELLFLILFLLFLIFYVTFMNLNFYNSALYYTSFAYTPDPSLHSNEYAYLIQLQGTVYHYQGLLNRQE